MSCKFLIMLFIFPYLFLLEHCFGWRKAVVFNVGMGKAVLKGIYFFRLNRPRPPNSKLRSTIQLLSSGMICFCQRQKEACTGLFVEEDWLEQKNKALLPRLSEHHRNCSLLRAPFLTQRPQISLTRKY